MNHTKLQTANSYKAIHHIKNERRENRLTIKETEKRDKKYKEAKYKKKKKKHEKTEEEFNLIMPSFK